jgi:protein SCO1
MMMRAIFIGILVLMSAGIGAATFNWYRTEHVARSFGEPFILVDHTGEEITEQAFRGTPTALFFGFTHCPEVCPTTLWELDTWLDEMDGAVNGYFVSIDPERDTVDVMGNYVTNVSDRITGITGEPDKIAAMARSFGIYVNRVELDGGDYTMDHTASILLLDRDGDFAGTIAYGENSDTARAKLERLANGA